MRILCLAALFAALAGLDDRAGSAAAQVAAEHPGTPAKDTPAAGATRARLLRTKVDRAFSDARLGDILKEFAAQVEMKTDQQLFWTYGPGFPYSKKLSYTAKELPLEVALDEVLTKAGGGLGYVVVSNDGDKHDGWIRLTTTGERGRELPPPTAEDEAIARDRLALAKKLIDGGKPVSARPLLEILVKKYGATKAGMEARELLEKIEK